METDSQELLEYSKLKENTQSYFFQINLLRCPAFNYEPIHFTNDGFRHLMYKGTKKRQERDKKVQTMKFKLLPKARKIVEISTTYQEYDEHLIEITKKSYKKMAKETVLAKYWGLVAIIDNFRTKVVIRQIGNGQKHFWSVIPAWSRSYYRDIKIISNAKGDLSED